MEKTFKELNGEASIIKEIKKSGLSIAVIFSKDEAQKFNLDYGDKINLDLAKIIKTEK